MTERIKKRGVRALAFLLLLPAVILALPKLAFAAKSLTLSVSDAKVEVGKALEVKVEIDTGGDKVNAIGFSIDFPTETLEGLLPSQAGSVFPMCATLSATRYECGISGRDGFSGKGLVTTLVFKGRTIGTADISIQNFEAHFGPTGDVVTGFTANSLAIDVSPAGETSTPTNNTPPPAEETPTPQTPTPQTPTGNQTPATPINVAPPVATPEVSPDQSTTATPPPEPSQSLGSESQVQGQKGTQPEEPLKPADSAASTGTVKGLFSGESIPYLSIFPTILMLLLVGFLAAKLIFTEKKRHLEIERLFETEIGTLAALESKLDLVDQKGIDGKEKFLEEFESVKSELMSAESKTASDQSAGASNPV